VVVVGAEAPDFTLKDQDNQRVTLSSHRGERNVLLVFFPFAYSGVCTGEFDQLRDELAEYRDVRVIGVSVDHVYSLKAWSRERGYPFSLLADFWPHGEVAKAYGVFDHDRGMALRGTFLVDVAGVVRFAEVNQPGEPRDQGTWKKAVAGL
jgi:peroxiredoxin (alkyl hydroperoxide reductase subunit C)